jgi:small-conductance mechanosensitive channel
MDTQQTINLSILREFRQRGIRIPYPTQTLHLSRDLSVETVHGPVLDS